MSISNNYHIKLRELLNNIEFSIREGFVSEVGGKGILKKADEIGAMLWGILKNS